MNARIIPDELLRNIFLYVSEGSHYRDSWLWTLRTVSKDYYRVASSLIWERIEFWNYGHHSRARDSFYVNDRGANDLYDVLQRNLRENGFIGEEFIDAVRAILFRRNIPHRFEVVHNLSEAICCNDARYPKERATALRATLIQLASRGVEPDLLRDLVLRLQESYYGCCAVVPGGFYSNVVTPWNAHRSLDFITRKKQFVRHLEIRLHQWEDGAFKEVLLQALAGCEFESCYIYFHGTFERQFLQFTNFLRTIKWLRSKQLRIQATLPHNHESFYSTELFATINGLNRSDAFDLRVGSQIEYTDNPPGLLLGATLRTFELKLSHMVSPEWVTELLQTCPSLSCICMEVYGIDFSECTELTLPSNITHFAMIRHPAAEIGAYASGVISGIAVTCLEILGTTTLFYITYQFPNLERMAVDDQRCDLHCVNSKMLRRTCQSIKQLEHLMCYSITPDLAINLISRCRPRQSLTFQGVKSMLLGQREFSEVLSFQKVAATRPLPPKVLLDPGPRTSHAELAEIAQFFISRPSVKKLFLPYEFFTLSPGYIFYPLTVEVATRRSTRSFPYGGIYTTTFFRSNRMLNRRL